MAKLSPEQLLSSIDKKLAPVYIVSGDEPLLIQESCDAIRAAARNAGYSDNERYNVETSFDWNGLLYNAQSLSLFSEKKLIELRIPNGKPGDEGGKALREYCANMPEDTVLLVVLPKLDKRAQSSAWYKTLAELGDVVTIWPISGQQLPRWLSQRLKMAGVNANPEAVEVLSAKVEGNLLAAVQEIEKLKLIAGNDRIDAKTMAEAVMESARYNVFDLIDKTLAGNAPAASQCLSGLRAEGNVPPVILALLSNNVRSLCRIKEAMSLGQSFDNAANAERIWSTKKSVTSRAVDRLKLGQLYALLRLIANADMTIKGVRKGDAWDDLQNIVLRLCAVSATPLERANFRG